MCKHIVATKLFLLVAVFSFFDFSAVPTIAQQEPSSTDNLYVKALNAYLDEAKRKYAAMTTRDYDNLLVLRNDEITESMPATIGTHRITYKTNEELKAEFGRTRSKIPITIIQSMKNEGNRLVIHMNEYWFSASRKKYLHALEGGCKVEFMFDCSKKQFVIEKVSLWGV